ncbi:hypothetical protein ACR6C2_22625 [Streptomyces sp. INA 01156]
MRLALDSAPHDSTPRPTAHTESTERTERPPEPVEGESTATAQPTATT